MGEWKFANKFIELPSETIFRVMQTQIRDVVIWLG